MSYYDDIFLTPEESHTPKPDKPLEEELDPLNDTNQQDCDYWESNCYGKG